MLTNSFTNIVPTLNADGSLASISFTVTSIDLSGNTASQDVTGNIDTTIVPAGSSFTNDELTPVCDSIAEKQGVYNQMLIKFTPVFKPMAPVQRTDDQVRADLSMRVDAAARQVYDRFTAFQVEYDPREAAAQAYKDAGYTGDPTTWVTDFTDNAGLTVQAGVDLILSQAATLRAAIQTLAGYRMRKYKITNAATLDLAQQEYDSIMTDIVNLDASLR